MCIHLDTMRALVKRADEQKMTEERHTLRDPRMLLRDKEQEAQLMLTTGSTRLVVSRGQQTWYHSTCYI